MHTGRAELEPLSAELATDVKLKGRKQFEVELPLPQSFFGSLELVSRKIGCKRTKRHDNARIAWSVTARVRYRAASGSMDQFFAEALPVVVVGESTAPDRVPHKFECVERIFSGCCVNRGDMHLVAKLDSSSYEVGATMTIHYGLDNKSKVRCLEVIAEIWQRGAWQANNREGGDEWLLASDNGRGVDPGDSFGIDHGCIKVTLPEKAVEQSLDLGLLVVQHYVVLLAQTPVSSLVKKNAQVILPFTILRSVVSTHKITETCFEQTVTISQEE